MAMTLEMQRQGQSMLISLRGGVREQESRLLRQHFAAISEQEIEQLEEIVVDMEGVTFFGSPAIGTLVGQYKRLEPHGIRMRLASPPACIVELFQSLRLDTIFEVT